MREEVAAALRSMSGDKAPWPNEFSMAFFSALLGGD